MNSRISRALLVTLPMALAGTACGAPANSEAGQAIAQVTSALKSAGVQGLNGKVVVHDSAGGTTTVEVNGKDVTSTSLEHRVTFDVTKGRATAQVSYSLKTTKDSLLDYDQHTVQGFRSETTIAGGKDPQASVSLDLRDDGTYVLSFNAGGVSGKWTMDEQSKLECKPNAQSCNPSVTKNGDSAPQVNLGGLAGDVDGRLDPGRPNLFGGSVGSKIEFPDGGGTRTVTWTLTR